MEVASPVPMLRMATTAANADAGSIAMAPSPAAYSSGADSGSAALAAGAGAAAAAAPVPSSTDGSSSHVRPADVLALAASRRRSSPTPPPTLLREESAGSSIGDSSRRGSVTALVESRRRPQHAHSRQTTEERTGFARIYFENHTFTSSTVFKLTATMNVLEVRKSMATKINIPPDDFDHYVIVAVYPSDSARSLSARTLRDDELMLPLVEKINRVRALTADSDDGLGTLRPKPKHRSRPALKFILKDIRGPPLDLEEEQTKKESTDTAALTVPAFLGKGVRCGYLQKASVKDPNVWRKRWFVVKDDQLLYCKSATNQRDVTAISLLSSYLMKARDDVHVPYSFILRTPRRAYQLCANSKEDMAAWIYALHVQIGISTENHRLYEAEISITEDAVSKSEGDSSSSTLLSEPSLLQRVLSREDTLKSFRDFSCSIGSQPLLDTWIEIELFRRNCIEREASATQPTGRIIRRTAKEEWDHLKSIIRAAETLPMINSEEVEQLRQSFHSEQINRRLSIALHAGLNAEYPRVDLIASIHQKIFDAIETGPFKQFLSRRGYRTLLERVMGRIV